MRATGVRGAVAHTVLPHASAWTYRCNTVESSLKAGFAAGGWRKPRVQGRRRFI